jgi:hypothetical protein
LHLFRADAARQLKVSMRNANGGDSGGYSPDLTGSTGSCHEDTNGLSIDRVVVASTTRLSRSVVISVMTRCSVVPMPAGYKVASIPLIANSGMTEEGPSQQGADRTPGAQRRRRGGDCGHPELPIAPLELLPLEGDVGIELVNSREPLANV